MDLWSNVNCFMFGWWRYCCVSYGKTRGCLLAKVKAELFFLGIKCVFTLFRIYFNLLLRLYY